MGKSVVFLPNCHSTNEEAKRFCRNHRPQEGTVFVTDYQRSGKGQQGNVWVSEEGKNLLFSVVLYPKFLLPQDQFYLNIVASLALQKAISQLLPAHKIKVKWPNDLYGDDHKMAGILIESALSGNQIDHAVVGIGLNVNQTHFHLPLATSMAIASGKKWEREDVLEQVLLSLESGYNQLRDGQLSALMAEYEKHLYKLHEPHTFRLENTSREGTVLGITPQGLLRVYMNGREQTFRFKELVW
jgi:BirA family transcriptional regulator, biotin operon repressor / biotin---[acetyl-CoA-carboxylase] ligase